MAHRYVDRSHVGPAPEHGAHPLALVDQGCGVALLRIHVARLSHQDGLGHAHRGHAEEEPSVAGEAEAPGMGVAVGVEDHGVGPGLQAAPRRGQGRELAEGEEPGHVGERHLDGRGGLLHRLHRLRIHHDQSRVAPVPAPDDREVGAGHEAG